MTITTDLPPRLPGQLSPIGEKLFSLARQLEDFANEFTERLSFEDYDNLTDMTARMLAYGNLLESRDRPAFLNDELREVADLLAFLKQRVQAPD